MTDFDCQERTEEEWAEIVSDLLLKNKQYETAIKEALELMKHGGHGTRSKVWNVLKKALEVNEQ